ncbi:PREDICTED: LOW QUALITY PROTEIN: transcription initiation factor TFIID subunit 1b-like [Camelina sativa]|uniref:LOW QUALITY PROTEIN: transcription initiation factor TFIID subunit 1b-like n=1 Tax=Camelina sativa TaxID=90675 RepID=A0ABM0W5P3_CAMSA|nr:PREDICTED: LOW QUALITY PROTEIN: transcription initiation factor TFIID subunit 1b-like [Camelina sativa]
MSDSNDDETSSDSENNGEEYDGPEVQVVTEEDHLLPKGEYFSAAFALGSLNSRASVFDDEDYDEIEEQEEEHAPVDKSFVPEESEPVVLNEEKAVEYEKEACILGNEDQMDTGDVQEEELDDISEGNLDKKSVTPLPTLYLEDGMVVFQFSEIFSIQEPRRQKRHKRKFRCITYRDKYLSMDISELVEDDEEVLLKSHGRIDTHVKEPDLIQLDVPFSIREGSQLVKAGTVRGTTPESREFTKLGSDSCITDELLKQDSKNNNSSLCQSQLEMEIFPLDQQEWEHRILWENSPEFSGNSGESFKSGIESESMLVQVTNSETEQESVNVMNSGGKAQADNDTLMPFIVNPLESFGSRGSLSTYEMTNKRTHHPQLLRLESHWDEGHRSENDNTGGENIKWLNGDVLGGLNGFELQDRDMGDEAWLDSIIWESDKDISRSKLIFDLQDEHMVFEVPDNEESLQLHSRSMIVSQSSKPKDGTSQECCESNSGWQFNISNDQFYTNGKSSQLQGNAKKYGEHSLRVFHSAPAIKLQTMKIKLSNIEKANFHRPKALWYPHDNALAIKQLRNLPTQGSMKVVVKSLGGKGSLLHVGREESVSSLKSKASRKLDFKDTEAVKMFYMGKELEDEKSLAEQNVQPNSLVHILRTKVHLWPWKLPGENISLRPPGAFKKKSDLSTQDGHVFLMEYCEERPLMLSNVGMGANFCTYYQKSSPEDQHGNLLHNQRDTLGSVMILEPGDKSPFLGKIHSGCSQSSVETNMYKAPVFPHRLQSTDYLLVRSAKGKLSIRRIDKIVAVGQQEPRMEIMSPASKKLQTYLVNRMMVYVYREFKLRNRIAAYEPSFLFSNLSDAVIRKNMKVCADLERDKNGKPYWSKIRNFDKILPELKNLVAPEDVCSYESMQAGLYRLKQLGITRFTLPASISTALAQLPDEVTTLAAASRVERELQTTPWNLSRNFVICTTQGRANIERLEITGVGDPSGRGLGFSYVRSASDFLFDDCVNSSVLACVDKFVSCILLNWQVDKAILKTPRGKQVKEISNPVGKLKNIKILKVNQKVFKGGKTARASFVCGACGQHGHMKTNRHCPKYRENTESHLKSIDMKKSAGKPSSSDLSGEVWLKPIENKKTAPKSATKLSVNEAAKIGDSTSNTWGLPAGGLIDKRCSETPGNSELADVSNIDTGTKLTSRVSKLNISSKEKFKELKVASDSPSQSLRLAISRKRRESESHNSSVSEKLLPSTEPNQATLSRHTISVPQLSLSMDKDQAESCRHHRAIWPPTEREHQQKKLVIQRSKEITDHDIGSLRDTPQFESRTTKRIADFQTQQRLRLSENFLDWGRKEERMCRKEQDMSMDRHREGKVRRDYNDITVSEERSEIAEIRRYEEVLWSEREEGERQKAKKKNMLQREIIEDYPRRRLSERGQNISSLCVSDIERNGEEYVPQPKRRKKGEVGLANILESIVDTLRAKEVNVSYLFLKPVSKKEARDYLDIVERPMDLSTIRDKVRRMEYSDRKQFRRDVWQINYNAHLYNDGRNLAIPPLADELLLICDRLLDEYRLELTEAEEGIASSHSY